MTLAQEFKDRPVVLDTVAAREWATIARGAPLLGAMAAQAGQWGMLGQAIDLAEKAALYAGDGYTAAVMGSRPDRSNRLVAAVLEAGVTASDAEVTAAAGVVAQFKHRAIRAQKKKTSC
jgi:hypothetical protein